MYAVRGEHTCAIGEKLVSTRHVDLMRGAKLFEVRSITDSTNQYLEILRVPDRLGNFSEDERSRDAKAVAVERLVEALFIHAYKARDLVCPDCERDHIIPLESTRFWSCVFCGFEGLGDEFKETDPRDPKTTIRRRQQLIERTIDAVIGHLRVRGVADLRPESARAMVSAVKAALEMQDEMECPRCDNRNIAALGNSRSMWRCRVCGHEGTTYNFLPQTVLADDDAEKEMRCPNCRGNHTTEIDNLRSIWMCNHCGYKAAVDCFLVETSEGEEGQD